MDRRGGPGSRCSVPRPGSSQRQAAASTRDGRSIDRARVEVRAFLEDLDGQDQRAVARAGLEEDRGMIDGPERRRRTAEEDGVRTGHAERDRHLGGHDGRRRLREVDAAASALDEARFDGP